MRLPVSGWLAWRLKDRQLLTKARRRFSGQSSRSRSAPPSDAATGG
jgi:hypothetical protein